MAKHTDAAIKTLIRKMTLKEKCSLLSGGDFWHTQKIERLGIPAIMVSDGPHGLRKQSPLADAADVNESITAVCFPTACATACSFDKELYNKLGQTLGDECQANDVSTLLGPAVNIKRSPLCGRNFEYISEDPFVAGKLAAAYINGVQSKNVGTSIKHFALNNQEYRRLTNSSNCDERTMREIYLPAFETAVKESQPKTVMHSYNIINGTYAGESEWLLTQVLRKEWGFLGVVMSDWGAVSNRVAGVKAGGDLEMPSTDGRNDKIVEAAVKKGLLKESYVDQSVFRILRWVFDFTDNRKTGNFDIKAHHDIARQIEEESIVLLQNNGVLPLSKTGSKKELALIGLFAQKPRYQGGGSSHIKTATVVSAKEAFETQGIPFTYAQGYSEDGKKVSAAQKEALIQEAVQVAKKAKVALVFAGLPDSFESEGYDRSHMDMPEEQNELIERICAVNKNTVVVLHNGSPVTMPWKDKAAAIVECYLGGEAVGEAVVNILTGKANPCAKLAETFPCKLEDNPSYPFFACDKDNTPYNEGIFVGYRWYDMRRMPVLFPFGHGLSYTTFEYTSCSVSKDTIGDRDSVTVTVTVKNTGKLDGKEIVQLYVADKTKSTVRPPKELKGFEKVFIKAGQSAQVTFKLDKRSFAWYCTDLHDWYAAEGQYEILTGSSSRDIKLTKTVTFKTKAVLPLPITPDTALGDLMKDPRTKKLILQTLKKGKSTLSTGSESSKEAITEEMQMQMDDTNPLRNLCTWYSVTDSDYKKLLKALQPAVR